MEEMQPEMAEQEAPMEGGPQMLSEQDEQDIDIVVAAALEMLEGETDGPPIEEVLGKLLSSSAPEKQLAMFLTQMIEAVQTTPEIVELGVNPAIWMAEGGVLDELTDDLSDIVGQDITDIVQAAKPIILQNVGKRAEQFAQEGQPQEAAPQGLPQAPRPVMAGA